MLQCNESIVMQHIILTNVLCTVYCQAIEKQLKICGYKSNVDVVALYLARQ